MKNWWLLLLVLMVCGSACTFQSRHEHNNGENKDTLAFTYKTIKQRASDCSTKPDSACTLAEVVYPEFKNSRTLNDSVKNKLFNLFWNDTTLEPDTDMQKYVSQFIDVYEKSKNDPAIQGRVLTVQSKAKVIRQDSSLTTLEIGGYMYQGGAHGSTVTIYYNWDTKTNKALKLDDLFNPGYITKLTAVGDTIFRKDEKLSDTASLAQNYFFAGNEFALNRNFMITPDGLLFLYNQYEIKPYAAGQTKLLIPYTKIKSLLKPHTVISQYIK